MARALLATEGPSEDRIGTALLMSLWPEIELTHKQFPARGIAIVKRSLVTLARAAHFGFFDLLVVQFDIDDGCRAEGVDHVQECSRWKEIRTGLSQAIQILPDTGRPKPVLTVLQSGRESTDAWISWGIKNGDGATLEHESRHKLKTELYGDPPRNMVEKAPIFADQLVQRMSQSDSWPPSLRFFVDQVKLAKNA